MLLIKATTRFLKDLKLAKKRGYNIDKLEAIVDLLQAQKSLPPRNRDHHLTGEWNHHRRAILGSDLESCILFFLRIHAVTDMIQDPTSFGCALTSSRRGIIFGFGDAQNKIRPHRFSSLTILNAMVKSGTPWHHPMDQACAEP